METAVAVEVSAVEVRDRLLGFVEGVAARLPLRRQRENALVYVRGLIEQGGRKSYGAGRRCTSCRGRRQEPLTAGSPYRARER